MQTSYHSYPSIYALGHRYLQDLLLDPVVVEEKVDGSQFSFGRFETEHGLILKCRSKGAQINTIAPDNMFKDGVDYVKSIEHLLMPGWTYRGEYLKKPKHNALVYDRIPKNHIILFDINLGHEDYMRPVQSREHVWDLPKQIEAERLGLECVPALYIGKIESVEQFRAMLDTVSVLGGQKIEGVVIKNYNRFGVDKKALFGKFVSEAFKEVHNREWKAANPGKMDIVASLIDSLKTPARWNKAVQHLREAGSLQDAPQDIGLLMREVPNDVEKEERDFITGKLFDWAWPHIRRGVVEGLPEWYKDQLVAKQFEHAVESAPSLVGEER